MTSEEMRVTRAQAAAIVGIHGNTLLRKEAEGLIRSVRDRNNWRKYSLPDLLKLKMLLAEGKPSQDTSDDDH